MSTQFAPSFRRPAPAPRPPSTFLDRFDQADRNGVVRIFYRLASNAANPAHLTTRCLEHLLLTITDPSQDAYQRTAARRVWRALYYAQSASDAFALAVMKTRKGGKR